MIRRLNMPVTDVMRFAELTGRRRLLGVSTSAPSYQLLRETYFDTSDGTLAERDMTLRLRSEAHGCQILQLSILHRITLQGIIEEESFETPVIGGLYATLAGGSEIATRVREVVEAHALRPRAAVDIDRETRDLRTGRFGRAAHRIAFDEVIAHAPGVARSFHEVSLIELGRGKASLETLADRLRTAHGVVSDGLDTFGRVRQALVAPGGAPRAEMPNDVRVALMMLRDWEIALREGPNGLALPGSRGSGEDMARELLGELHGGDAVDGLDIDLVGFATARRGGSDLEIWLHQMAGSDRPPGFVWLPLTELMERLGGPRLRDPGLIATMLMLVRSEIGQRLMREAPGRTEPPVVLPLGVHPDGLEVGEGEDDFLDPELSIVDFNQRVLELAEAAEVPLLERFRFLSIFASNVDEFFVVRVGRLKSEVSSGGGDPEEKLSPEQLLDLVTVRTRALLARQYACLEERLLPSLAEHGVRLVTWGELTEVQRMELSRRFSSDLFPLLTPLTLSSDPGRSFPRLESLGLALAVSLRRGASDRSELGYIPLPRDVDRFLEVPSSNDLIAVEQVIGANAGELFPSARVERFYAFRATRLGNVDIDEDSSGSLLAAIADEVEARPYKPVIRIEVDRTMPREIRASILKAIRDGQTTDAPTVTRSDIYEMPGLLDLTALDELCGLDIDGGVYPPHDPRTLLDSQRSIFEILSESDVLCHHPFHGFESTVGRFLSEAAADPQVVSIKLTLYRTGRHSPVVDSLLSALQAGKDVSVFVELKARFDEESNIHWTHRLKEAGARVVYGVVGYKTHAKTALVVRREGGRVRRYVHVGTGNYNTATARLYTDLGLMSADPDLGADLNDFFNELTGGAGPPQKQFRRLLVAPHSLAQGVEHMIEREMEHARAGRPARIRAKLNGLADRKVVRALYRASDEGVYVDLIVRSVCTLRPGVPGLSDRIRVRSILGRFLEHSRIYYFENTGQSEYYIGSADWRRRNLRRRVEVVVPVDDPSARAVLRAILDAQMDDPRAWSLRPDGVYERLRGDGPDSQEWFMLGGENGATSVATGAGASRPTSISRR